MTWRWPLSCVTSPFVVSFGPLVGFMDHRLTRLRSKMILPVWVVGKAALHRACTRLAERHVSAAYQPMSVQNSKIVLVGEDQAHLLRTARTLYELGYRFFLIPSVAGTRRLFEGRRDFLPSRRLANEAPATLEQEL